MADDTRPRNRAGKTGLRFFLALLPVVILAGCTNINRYDEAILKGGLYKRVRVPLTRDLHYAPALGSAEAGKIIRVTEPFSGYSMYTELDSNAIGDIAERHGLDTVYFADHEIFNVLGIWQHDKVLIYGETQGE
jgi:hypothetical protein